MIENHQFATAPFKSGTFSPISSGTIWATQLAFYSDFVGTISPSFAFFIILYIFRIFSVSYKNFLYNHLYKNFTDDFVRDYFYQPFPFLLIKELATASLSGLIAFILSPIRSRLASSLKIFNSFSAFSFPSSAAFSSSAIISLYLAFAFYHFLHKLFLKVLFYIFYLLFLLLQNILWKLLLRKSLIIFFHSSTSIGFNMLYILSD